MRCTTLLAVVAVAALVASLHSAEVTDGPLKPGALLPGSFHPYNVNARLLTPEEAAEIELDFGEKGKKDKYSPVGKFHCLVSEYDLDPVVLLFVRDLEENSAGFKELLKKLDEAIEKNRVRRLRTFVVSLNKDVKDIVVDDDRRGEMAKKSETLVKDLDLKNIVLTLAADADVKEKYQLDDTVALTAVLYKALRVVKTHTFARDELDKEDTPVIATLLKATAEMIKPK